MAVFISYISWSKLMNNTYFLHLSSTPCNTFCNYPRVCGICLDCPYFVSPNSMFKLNATCITGNVTNSFHLMTFIVSSAWVQAAHCFDKYNVFNGYTVLLYPYSSCIQDIYYTFSFSYYSQASCAWKSVQVRQNFFPGHFRHTRYDTVVN